MVWHDICDVFGKKHVYQRRNEHTGCEERAREGRK